MWTRAKSIFISIFPSSSLSFSIPAKKEMLDRVKKLFHSRVLLSLPPPIEYLFHHFTSQEKPERKAAAVSNRLDVVWHSSKKEKKQRKISKSLCHFSFNFHTCPLWDNRSELRWSTKKYQQSKWNRQCKSFPRKPSSPPRRTAQNHFRSNALCVRLRLERSNFLLRTQTAAERKSENVIYEWFYSFDMFSFPSSTTPSSSFECFTASRRHQPGRREWSKIHRKREQQ